MDKQVVVSGIGILSPFGYGADAFKDALEEGVTCIDHVGESSSLPIKVGALIKDFSFEAFLGSREDLNGGLKQKSRQLARRTPISAQCSILAVLDAWHNARLEAWDDPSLRKGIVVGGSNLSQNFMHEMQSKHKDSPEFITPSYGLHFMDTFHVGILSELFSIHGEGFNVGGASASGNVALIKGMQMIRHNEADICIVVGTMADLSSLELMALTNLNAMGGKDFANEPQKACRPFDKKHEGFIYGQAAACIILESKESALKREIKPLAEMVAGVQQLDGNRLSDPSEDGEVRVMASALQRAGLRPEDIDYINTHGTSTPLGDITETNAIKRVFGESIGDIYINSTKGITGHCLYSAGVVEAIATIIQMNNSFVHRNVNLEEPICDLCKLNKEKITGTHLNYAISNSFGFGGINTSIILRRWNEL